MNQMRGYGLNPHPCGHGVTAELGRGGGRTFLLRADMDALPMPEESGESFACPTGTEAHTCGHDFHTRGLPCGQELYWLAMRLMHGCWTETLRKTGETVRRLL